MKNKSDERALPATPEQIRLHKPIGRIGLTAFAFLICISILIAAFAVSQIWKRSKKNVPEQPPADRQAPPVESSAKETRSEEPLKTDEEPTIPETATPVVIRSYPDSGVRNETTVNPDAEAMPTGLIREEQPFGTDPVVLILHTHPQQAYLTGDAAWIDGPLGVATYSNDLSRNVTAVGEILCQALCRQGIPAVHAVENQSQASSLGGYAHAAETIAAWRATYPGIRLVIDVQRDAILDADGNYIRPVAEPAETEKVAQVMAIVGSNAEGDDFPEWQKNYALALALRAELNRDGSVVMRTVSVRRSTYNQELSPYALLLEIGSGANTVEEAGRAAERIALALAGIL